MGRFYLNGETILYRFEKKERMKHIRLSFVSADEVRVAAPHTLTEAEIQAFLSRQEKWIAKHRGKLRQKEAQTPRYRFVTGERFLYLGQEIPLWIPAADERRDSSSLQNLRRVRVKLRETGLASTPLLCLQWTGGSAEAPIGEEVRSLLQRWYRKEAKRVLLQRLSHFQPLYPFPYNQVRVKDQKTRWGSCSSQKNLNFNWRLVMAPLPVLDYIVVHELCHLKEMNHSPAFWRLVARHIPDYRAHKRWLKENGHRLIW